MTGLALTREAFQHSIQTYEVKGLLRGARTEATFATTGIDMAEGINDEPFDGVDDYVVDDLVLVTDAEIFDDASLSWVAAPQLDGVYRVTDLGHSHQNPLLERSSSMAVVKLIEVLEGDYFSGTFWKNLTLPSSYVEDESPVLLEQQVEAEA